MFSVEVNNAYLYWYEMCIFTLWRLVVGYLAEFRHRGKFFIVHVCLYLSFLKYLFFFASLICNLNLSYFIVKYLCTCD